MTLAHVNIQDEQWSPFIEQICKEIIPYQYDVLNDGIEGIPSSHAIENFRIAAKKADGEYQGMLFQDSDVGKWIEAASYSLMLYPSAELETKIDSVVELLACAQQEDGYLNTYYTCVKPEERFTNIAHGHELYCCGHLLEGAIAYCEATGKTRFLDIMTRYVDYIISRIGPDEGKLKIYSGHPEIELAVFKLYKLTGCRKYLDFVSYLISERGKQPSFLEKDKYFGEKFKDKWYALPYHQAHLPITQQNEAKGHAVRALYLYCGVADLACETNNAELITVLENLWHDVTERKMYVTGAVGSEAHGESFGTAYDLPNDRAYAETCASIALVFLAKRMLKISCDSKYSDVMERALYNGAMSGIGKDGKKYFYVNPLQMIPNEVETRYDLSHVEPSRVTWFGCACCPPNISRLAASLKQYICDYDNSSMTLAIHLFISGCIELEKDRRFEATGSFLSNGVMNYTFYGKPYEGALMLRKPGWSKECIVRINDKIIIPTVSKGYYIISRTWTEGDVLSIEFDLTPRLLFANPQINADVGRVCITRGPIVYCLEEVDNGANLNSMLIQNINNYRLEYDCDVSSSVPCIICEGYMEDKTQWNNILYSYEQPQKTEKTIKAVPYFEWGNRGLGEMIVWIRKR